MSDTKQSRLSQRIATVRSYIRTHTETPAWIIRLRRRLLLMFLVTCTSFFFIREYSHVVLARQAVGFFEIASRIHEMVHVDTYVLATPTISAQGCLTYTPEQYQMLKKLIQSLRAVEESALNAIDAELRRSYSSFAVINYLTMEHYNYLNERIFVETNMEIAGAILTTGVCIQRDNNDGAI